MRKIWLALIALMIASCNVTLQEVPSGATLVIPATGGQKTLPAPQVSSATHTPAAPVQADQIPAKMITFSEIQEEALFTLIQQERQANGLSTLEIDMLLDQAAQLHSYDMAMQDFLDHKGFDGSYVHVRVTRQGYEYAALGETICANATAEECIALWRSSAEYQQVLLYEQFSQIGIGVYENPASTYGVYYTVVYAAPRQD